jgi:mannose-6-phosphate isomerase-like protein (cupin superfamily)
MKQLSRTITNPIIGDTVTFLETAEETGGKYCRVKVLLQPGGGNPLHYHTTFTEHFETIKGTLNVQIGEDTLALKAGQAYLIKEKVVHRFYNESPYPVEFYCTITPARQFESLLRLAYGLAHDNKISPKNGMPKNLFQAAIMFQFGESYLPNIPIGLQKTVFGILAKIGVWLGYKKALEKYYKGIIEPKEKLVQRNHIAVSA